MGNYNPYAPIILGQEWVPIREEETEFNGLLTSVELGHEFTLTQSQTLQDLRVYTADPNPQINPNPIVTAAIYRAGTEAETGPIQSVLIPVNSGGITGTGVSASGGSVAAALLAPDDSFAVSFIESGVTLQRVGMFFATNSYPQLANKRILSVGLRYVFNMSLASVETSVIPSYVEVLNVSGLGFDYGNLSDQMGTQDPESGLFIDRYGHMDLGNATGLWNPGAGSTTEKLPWTYSILQRFEATATDRLMLRATIQLNSSGNTDSTVANLLYLALEVFYCEENRLVVGGIPSLRPAPASTGVYRLPARTPGSYTANPTLTPGDYTVIVSSAVAEPKYYTPLLGAVPKFNALREYYPIPSHPGVQVNIPAPMDETKVGETFTREQTHILPQISVHTSGGPLVDVHVYGRQAVAQVYGANVAEQNIYDDVVGTNTSYPQVRFYARRFGDTTQALDFAGLNALSTSTASISVADFDNLDEIIDGWKEVTLRLSTPAVMGTLAAPDPVFRWSSAAETAGNRWEILGAIAPALSGVPGNLLNKVASPHQLGTATYGEPTSGDTVLLKWIPGYSPFVTGSTNDSTADAVVLFSTDPPAVSGFAVTMLSQAVSGIGPDCGVDPCCIPTEIFYNHVTWTALSSQPVSGFGAYELQRMDDLTDWQTIMSATDMTTSSFNDYEARVGIASSYRIRSTNVYNFAGPWSDTIAETIDDPGVTIGCGTGGHLLIFTSNSQQDGSINLAYSTVWEGTVNEDFEFPETGDVILQKMYGKNFVTAFRPLERGGERFSRTLLVQAAAIAPPTLGDFTALRDLAWDQVPYVCVRDEDGNRWFATIFVPSGRVQLNRTIYMAPITVQEVTDIPFPVDP